LAQLEKNISLDDRPINPELKEKIDLIDIKETELLFPYNWKE
jgi:hypothetical protein